MTTITTTTKVERLLGRPDACRLSVDSLTFTLAKHEVIALAASLAAVLDSYARDDEHAERRQPLQGGGR